MFLLDSFLLALGGPPEKQTSQNIRNFYFITI